MIVSPTTVPQAPDTEGNPGNEYDAPEAPQGEKEDNCISNDEHGPCPHGPF